MWEELWGCVHYLKIPYDTLIKLPVRIRKYWIMRNNQEAEREKAELENSSTSTEKISGVALNSYAKVEMDNMKNGAHM